MGNRGAQRRVRRTWRRTSELICAANGLPPGYRIVLVGQDGRVKRDDLRVRSGGFGTFPADFEVALFVEETLKDDIDVADLDFSHAELRDHRNQPVNPYLTLREVRDSSGLGGKYAVARDAAEELIDELQIEVEEAMSIFEDDMRLGDTLAGDSLLKAMVRYIVSEFDREAINHILNSDEVVRRLSDPDDE